MAIRRHGSAPGTNSTKSRHAFRRPLVVELLENRTLLSGNPVAVNDSYTLNQGQTLNVSSPASTSLSATSQPGDFIGQGRTYFYTLQDAGIGSSFAIGITPLGQMAGFVVKPAGDFNGQGWFGQMWAPPGTVLAPGSYPDVVSAGIPPALRAGHPALLVSFDDRTANDVTGNFTILEVAFDALGELQSLHATFEQHAEGMTPALLGEIKYNDHTEDVGVLDNDTDSDQAPLTALLTNAPAHGTLNLAPDGTFTYTPDAGFSGVDSFTYVANDGIANSNVATVNLNVDPVSLHLTSIPSTTAGVAENFTVAAEDASGNTLTNYAGTVSFSSSDVQAGLPATYTFGTADQGVHTFSVTLRTAGSQSITVQDAENGLTTGQSGILVSAAAASKLSLSGLPASTTAGANLQFSITALDPFNNIADNFGDTVHFSSTDGHATLPVDYTFAPADHGTHVFSTILKTAGSQRITAQDAASGSSAAPIGINVNADAASSLSVIGLPASALAGANLQFSITAFDPFGNVAVGFADTIQFSSGDNQAALPAAYSFTTADHGTHLFSTTFKTAGNQSLVGQDAANGLISGQTGILVSAAAASRLALTGLPASATAGANLLFSLTAFDPFNNIADSFSDTVHFSSSDSQAALPAAYSFTTADHGTHVFSAKLKTAGSQSITALDAGNGLTTGPTGVVVSAAAASRLALSGLPASATAGANLLFSLTAFDPFNNIADSFGDTVHFSSSDSRATLPAVYTFSTADHGSHQFSATPMTAGAETLTVTDASVSSVASTQASLVVNAGPTAKFVMTILNATIAGVPLSPVIKAFDAEDNPTPNYTGTIHFSSTDPKAVLPGDYTFLGSDQGSKTFSGVVFETAGASSFTVTDVANPALTGSKNGIAVSPGSAARIMVGNSPTDATAGLASNITITVLDAFDNVITGYTGTVHFSSTDKQAVLPSNYTFGVADHGIKTVPVTLDTAGPQSVTISDAAAPTVVATTSPISVSAAELAKLAFLQQPTTGPSGVAMKPAISVELLDAFGNIELGSTNQVTLAAGDSSSTLGGATSVAASNGVATFSNIIVNSSGVGLTLLASTSGVTAVPSAKFDSILLSNILPVEVAPQIYGPGPNTSADDAFVKGIYRTVLGRDADLAGLSFWVGNLNGGAARFSIVTSFWNSPENRGREVDAYYQTYLGRPAEPQGRSFWIGQLQAGADETAIVLSFLLSPEELSAPNDVFIQRLYQGALGRGASASEVSFWTGQLAQGQTRQQVANSFIYSSEAAGVAVDSIYEAYFQRTSDPAGRAFWVGQISDRMSTYASLAISLLESDEFFRNAAANVP